MDTDVFFNEWQRVAVDKAPLPYDQAQDLIDYAEWLQDGNARLNASRDASIKSTVFILVAQKPKGQKHERFFTDLMEALGFAALVNGTAYFWDNSGQFKVVWYDKE